MSLNSFAPKKFEDFAIVDEKETKVGSIRVKPSGILWAPKGSHRWYRVSLAVFAKFMVTKGRRQKK
jgi:hypothetical protein